MIEEYIPGREFTVGILDNLPLEAIEIKPKSRFFDYKAKYEDDKTEYIVPAKVPLKTMRRLSPRPCGRITLRLFFFSRADIIFERRFQAFYPGGKILSLDLHPPAFFPKPPFAKG